MKFSIVITTCNRLSLLKRAIASALNQSIPCEVIVVDDCSSDGTAEYIQSLGEDIIFYRNLKNMRQSFSVNVGVKAAQGDWIKLLDDDDYLAPNCIEEIMKNIAQYPEAVICSCQATQVDIKGVEICQTPKIGLEQAFYIAQADIHYGMLLEEVPFGTTSQVAFLRDAFLNSGGWDSSLDDCYNDIDCWLRIAQFGDAVFVNSCLVYRVVWSGSYNQKSSLLKRLNTNILIKEKIYNLVNPKYQSVLPPLSYICNYVKLHWLLVALKQKHFVFAIRISFPAVLSMRSWNILVKAMRSRNNPPSRKSVILKTTK
ncbi:glycosyltransferase family 2 protein [Microcystis aeruginosa]|jgi:glycosyltransferase involved in cell wall biosynthesis|uniref:Glycosyl transferase family protein n=1 Tax=Microcystis aeruginosa NIES-3787 TaxID=2517782 RepID=A0A6H9FJC8_MICAE|nr:glycosyltransferase family 2 protein [Microcystis aeruginosa]GCL44793.1 glycosyl transferase family protein [Microcystis aeruginosa NIES-3787]